MENKFFENFHFCADFDNLLLLGSFQNVKLVPLTEFLYDTFQIKNNYLKCFFKLMNEEGLLYYYPLLSIS